MIIKNIKCLIHSNYMKTYNNYKKLYENLLNKFKQIKIDNINMKQELMKIKKGRQCSVEGNKYEKHIYQNVKYSKLNNKFFNTQQITDLAGSSSKNDIECNFNEICDIGIEIKKSNTPDWMQCSLKYNKIKKIWEGSKRSKIPAQCKEEFNKLVNNLNIYDNEIPPFFQRKLTHEEWLNIKKETTQWNDTYLPIPNDTINKLYSIKKCYYIQISDYGLYHLGNDICGFGVPEFKIEQQIRIRIKVHHRKTKKGYCSLSVTAACQPININNLKKSNYSLDDITKLPDNLLYCKTLKIILRK